MNDLSRRELLGLGLKTGAGLLAASIPGVSKGQETETLAESPYSNPDIRVNNLGYPSLIFDQIAPEYYDVNEDPLIRYEHSPLGARHVYSFIPALENALQRIGLEKLLSYDALYLMPGQLFALPDGIAREPFEDDYVVGLADTSDAVDILPKLMGGVVNYNVGLENYASRNYDPEERMTQLVCHEAMHERGLLFPEFIILETGERVAFSNSSHLYIPGVYNEGLNTNLVHPHKDILGGGIPSYNYAAGERTPKNDMSNLTRSSLQLFLCGLITAEEFNNSFEGLRPHLLEINPANEIVNRHYYTVDALVAALDESPSWDSGQSTIQDYRTYAGLERFTPGYRAPQGSSKEKVGIIPLILADRRAFSSASNLGNNLSLQDNLIAYALSLESLKNFFNTQSMNKVEAEIVTAST